MSTAIHTEPRFNDDEAARQHLEAIRWPTGPVCPHCGGTERNVALKGKSHRAGLYFCGDCRTQFTVTVGTCFERSKIALHKWVYATHLMCASKKGISAKQLERMLGVTYKTAWFMAHRIREAMKPVDGAPPLGGNGNVVEADETYIGNIKGARRAVGGWHKHAVVALVERSGGVRSFHIPKIKAKDIHAIIRTHVARESSLFTDEAKSYVKVGREFLSHETVNHGKREYARGDVHTNTIEGYFSLLKRGIIGVYHHVGGQHLQRYCHEFDFRYTQRKITDIERAELALRGISGKRLTYRRIGVQ